MTKIRLSISLEPEEAELIRTAAAARHQDLSAFLATAGLVQAAREQRITQTYAEIDRAIAEAEAEAANQPWPADNLSSAESEQVRREIAAARARAARMRSSAA